jgi:hypothetical protein
MDLEMFVEIAANGCPALIFFVLWFSLTQIWKTGGNQNNKGWRFFGNRQRRRMALDLKLNLAAHPCYYRNSRRSSLSASPGPVKARFRGHCAASWPLCLSTPEKLKIGSGMKPLYLAAQTRIRHDRINWMGTKAGARSAWQNRSGTKYS